MKHIKQFLEQVKKRFGNLATHQQKNIICLLVIMAVGAFLGAYHWYNHRPSPATSHNMALSDSTAIESHSLVVGDIYWGRAMYDWSQKSSLKAAYPFSQLDSLHREQYDAWIGNLECPSVPGVKQQIGQQLQLWEFNCDSEFMPEASRWFDIFSIANNHSGNQQKEAGVTATRKLLDQNNIQYFGDFTPHTTDDICEVVAMPARIRLDGKQQQMSLPVAMCGFAGVYFTVTDKALAQMQAYSKVMPVIAMPHMGTEYESGIDANRQALYRKMIDNGADVVIGNHPHWVQPTEAYKGKLIVYSMGNFIFDQQFSKEVTRSAAIDMTLTLDKNAVPYEQLKGWQLLGDSCKVYKDDCLRLANEWKLHKLPFKYSYDIVGVDTSDKITKKADMQVYRQLLDRLQWHSTKTQLQ